MAHKSQERNGYTMTQDERRLYLIDKLLEEEPHYRNENIPTDADSQWLLLRSLMNVRPAIPAEEELLKIQDEYLSGLIRERGITDAAGLAPTPSDARLVIWKGDITSLKIDAIVNAANSRMEGCWQPCHDCIDNCIHTYSGIQLRLYCHDIMMKQGHEEPTGRAKLTDGYNLPAKYIIHTVGPIIANSLTQTDCNMLEACYSSCLELAAQNGCKAIAFCCISTGVFRFPKAEAADIAVETVKRFLDRDGSIERVVFNVFTQADERIYRKLLG